MKYLGTHRFKQTAVDELELLRVVRRWRKKYPNLEWRISTDEFSHDYGTTTGIAVSFYLYDKDK